MKFVFWTATALIVYVYVGYPAWLWLRGCWRSRPVCRDAYRPFVSIILVVRNEVHVIANKLNNLLALDYPWDSYEIVPVSDGSEDGTAYILDQYTADPRIRPIHTLRGGKAMGLNAALAKARGDVIVFTDARQKVALDARSEERRVGKECR